MRRLAFALVIAPLACVAASAPAQPQSEPLEAQVSRAKAEQRTAEAEAARLEQAAANARGEAARLHAQQLAAAQAIESAEARITASEAELRLAAAYLESRRARLAREQRPVSSLLAGLALMARRPPLLAIADRGSIDEFVKVRLLLDSTLPAIRRRTALLTAELSEGERLERTAASARAELVRSRQQLMARKAEFAELEQQATESAASTAGQAVSVGDVVLAAGEDLARLRGGAVERRKAAALASALAGEQPAPERPVPPDGAGVRAPFAYRLPAAADVIDGLGSVDASGVRSRGVTLATARGAAVFAPAGGIVRFAGSFRDYDGIVIIDHGGGWMSLLLNVASAIEPGKRVGLGQPLGRALGAVGVELSQNGRRISPALIAGSSQTLSKTGKGG